MHREDTDISEETSSTDRTLRREDFRHSRSNGAAAAAAEADPGVTSDEENDIMREIKEEIKRKVREDIKEELARYDLKNLCSRTESAASSARDQPGLLDASRMLPERDAKYTEAYQRMLKLDKILRKRMAREREVKRQRAMLEKRIKEELEQLRAAATSRRSTDEVSNTMKFLALTPSEGGGARRDADSELRDEYSDDLPHEPVFATEYLFEEANNNSRDNASGVTIDGSGTARSGKAANRQQQQQQDGQRKQRGGGGAAGGGDASKDFIKRNIELAGASNDVVAMTPEERERLDSLLRDLDSIPELPEEFLESSAANQLATLSPGEGYRVSDADSQRLREIDAGLARLGSVPPASVAAWSEQAPASARRQSELSDAYRATALQRALAGQDWDLDRLGEKALAEVKEERLMSHRLEEVNSRLALLSNESSQQGPLSTEAMSALLSDCARSIAASSSRGGSIRDANSQLGSHRSLQSAAGTVAVAVPSDGESLASTRLPDDAAELAMLVPPLDRAVLDKLLADARAAGIGQNWTRPEPITEEEEGLEEDEFEDGTLRVSSGMKNGILSLSSSDEDDPDEEDNRERLVLPDISLYANMSAPKTPNSGRYSAG